MSLGLFNLFESADLLARGTGMVRQRCLTLSSGTKQPYEVRSHQLPLMRLSLRSATPQKPLRADRPVTLVARLDPPKG